jgi:hypothetical protein
MARTDRHPEDEPDGRREGPRDRAEAVNRQRALQQQLRNMFDRIVGEPLPDEMNRLLEQIGRSDDDAERKDDNP